MNPFATWTQADVDGRNLKMRPLLAEGTPEEQQVKAAVKSITQERDLHDAIEAYCRARGYLYIHARMDVPSTIQVGHPDFTIFMPGQKCCFIECKRPGKKATIEQLGKVAHAKKLGFIAAIIDNFDEAKALIEFALKG